MLLHAIFAIFILATFDVVCLKSVRLKHSDCLSHFLDLNWKGLNLNLLILGQLLTDGDIESNPGPTQNNYKSPGGCSKKIKKCQKKCDVCENSNGNFLLGIQSYQIFSSIQYNLSA